MQHRYAKFQESGKPTHTQWGPKTSQILLNISIKNAKMVKEKKFDLV